MIKNLKPGIAYPELERVFEDSVNAAIDQTKIGGDPVKAQAFATLALAMATMYAACIDSEKQS